MKFVLEKGFASSLQWKDFNFPVKDRVDSQRLRNQGNQVYQKNKLVEALELYTQSICLAPHPPPSPNTFVFQNMPGGGGSDHDDLGGGHQYEELALGFANRSAVLFQLKEYELCIRDITRAFDNSYPNNLMYKLFERKARCLKALKEYPRALESMKSAEMWMKYSTLNETKSSSFKKDVAKQIEFLDEKVTAMSITEFKNTCDVRKNAAGPLHLTETPSTEGIEFGQEIPCVRSNVALEYKEGRGRLLVATEDIPPGEIIIVETPYSSILLPEYYQSHCQSCYMRVKAPIPCWFCAKVRFCSDICRVEAWERFHKVECQQLDLILDPTLGKMAMLSMRILTSSGKIYLDYIIGKLAEEEDARRNDARLSEADANRRLAFNEEEIYDAADYRTIYSLVGNTKQRGVGDLFKRALMALYLLKILEATPFFYNGGSDPRNVKLSDKVAMGAVLLKHLQNLPCNAHEVSEMELAGSNGGGGTGKENGGARDSTVNEIGAAVFGVLSLINHSCDPNVVRHYYSCNGVVRSIRTIKKGEELLDNYGYHYAVMPKEERQRKLYNQYYFRCDCGACAQNWPTYQGLPNTMQICNTTRNGGDNALSAGESKAVLAEANKMSKAFKKNFEAVLQGNFVEPVRPMLDYLKYLDGHVARPLREYNDCQEALKQCYSATANNYKAPATTSLTTTTSKK